MAELGFKKALRLYSGYIRERNWTQATEKGYCCRILYFFKYLDSKGITDLRDVSKKDVTAYADHLLSARRIRDNRPFSGNTKETYFLALRSLFKFLVRNDCLLADPTSGVELVKKEMKGFPGFLSEREMARVLKIPNVTAASGLRDRTILEVFYGTGIRKSELLHLKTTDVSFEDSLLFIDQGKGMKDRIVPLGDVARHFLRLYMETARRKLLSMGAQDNVLFVTYQGHGFSSNGVNKMLAKYLRAAGIKRQISVHSLRHTFASQLVLAGVSLREIQELMGHQSFETTLQYAHLAEDHVKRQVLRLPFANG